MYELYAILIHSGNASGGHYYAYIKDFGSGQWFCFNDQNVTRVSFLINYILRNLAPLPFVISDY